MSSPRECGHCGNPVPPRASACPTCGSDESTGWSEDAGFEGVDLDTYQGDDEFDYDEYVRREFEGGQARKSPAIGRGILMLTLMILASIVVLLLAR